MKKVSKNIIKSVTAIIMIYIIVCMAGCTNSTGSYIVFGAISNQNNTSFSMSYESFQGYKIYTINVKDASVLNIEFVTKDGTLDCKITDSNGDIMFQRNTIETGKESITLDSGKYTITLTAEEHKGSFSFDWKTKVF